MADKKLSSVNAVSDMNYVYAETASGETVKISKADLASVVAGQIGIVDSTRNGLVNKETAYILNGFNGWVGNSDQIIASIKSSYFCALVAVSQYNNPVSLHAVSVGSEGYGIRTYRLTGDDRNVGFHVSDGKLYITDAIDCNVCIKILCE